jgi:hypothetical protein
MKLPDMNVQLVHSNKLRTSTEVTFLFIFILFSYQHVLLLKFPSEKEPTTTRG